MQNIKIMLTEQHVSLNPEVLKRYTITYAFPFVFVYILWSNFQVATVHVPVPDFTGVSLVSGKINK